MKISASQLRSIVEEYGRSLGRSGVIRSRFGSVGVNPSSPIVDQYGVLRIFDPKLDTVERLARAAMSLVPDELDNDAVDRIRIALSQANVPVDLIDSAIERVIIGET